MKHTASDQQWRLLKIEEDQASRGDHHLHGSKESKETVSLMVLGMTDKAILSFSFFYIFTTLIQVAVYPKRLSYFEFLFIWISKNTSAQAILRTRKKGNKNQQNVSTRLPFKYMALIASIKI